jgi:D-alanine-D-alanine ligase
MKKRRILAILHEDLVPPESIAGLSEADIEPFKTEYDVTAALHNLGHEVISLGVGSDLGALRRAIQEHKPDIVFNLLEEFAGEAVFDANVVSYLELLRIPYTGCNPRGLMLARDKALSKTILGYHRIPVPDFAVFPRDRKVRRPGRLQFPLIIKSVNEEASLGIAHASIVEDEQKLQERVAFIHKRIGTDAIAESYVDGREFYVGVVGNQRLQVLPVWELLFRNMPEELPRIATARVKHDSKYQKKRGITTKRADNLSEEVTERIGKMCKRIYRLLGLRGYARIDLRMTSEGRIYVLEANPNPQLALDEDFADAAHSAGLEYDQLCQKIVNLGLQRARKLGT